MDIEHVKLQLRRLIRHYEKAKSDKDPISFLDLAHCLRIWVDMKKEIDELFSDIKWSSDAGYKQNVRKILEGHPTFSIPLSRGVDSPGIKVKGLTFVRRRLSKEEIKKLYELGPPQAGTSNMSFTDWLGAELFDITTDDGERLALSRLMLIKRVANMLGASHPQGTETSNEIENRFDIYIERLHQIEVADGYPLTYYQLIEIASEISSNLNHILSG